MSGRPKFADLHIIFDQFLSHHTEELYPYIDIGFSNMPYKFDHLTPKREQEVKAEDVLDLDTGEYCGEAAGVERYNGTGDTTIELGSISEKEDDHKDERVTVTQEDREAYVKYRARSKERRNKERRNGVVKGPYDELRLEDYLMLVERAKEARKRQTPAEDSGEEDSSMPTATASSELYRRESVMKTLSTITEASCEDEGFSDGDHHQAIAVNHQAVRGYHDQADNQPIAMADYDKTLKVQAVIVGGYDETAI